jgi:hypothetical protein
MDGLWFMCNKPITYYPDIQIYCIIPYAEGGIFKQELVIKK